uniref:Uncharacterized protein n=1 Tax=Anguilla anguilla TaxID=7936 RepID=A0A0E9UJL3_ANGAN
MIRRSTHQSTFVF